MHLATFSLLLLGYATLFFATERGVAQSAELSASRLRSAPTSIKLSKHSLTLTADLWYDNMPSVGNTYRKSLLGQITLSSSQSRFPRLSVKRVWVVHGEKVWSCRTEPQAVRPSPSVLQLRLTHTPSIDELPSDAVVFVAARLFYRNRTYLIRTPEQTVQTVY